MPESADWQTVDRHLDELLGLEPAAQRQRLGEVARENPSLGERLERLIDGIARSAPLEDISASPVYQEALAALDGPGPGDRLGDWVLQRRTGRGGMAEVFEATRTVGEVEQRAALKLMTLGLGSEAQRRRFRQETAILARLDDHRLSRLIDAGTAADGRPWLAMEFIDGEPIDRACERREYDVRQRVRLLIEVCQAVDYCHRALVVHRDLKPSNIFVTAAGHVRLLDFGIAKVRDADADPQHTATRARAFTMHYASPEQLTGRFAGVESDVYQLGLVLYRLLTGRRAFAGCEQDPVALQRAMADGPAPPSQCIGPASGDPAAGHGARRGSGRRLGRASRSDLDSVVLHALEADPRDRYPGAREFAEDLQRWLDGRPIAVRSYSRAYRAARYLRRHWLGAGSVAAIVLLLIGYAVTVTWQSARLAHERNQSESARLRAESIQEFLLQVFGSVDPQSQTSRGKSVEQLLIEGVDRARTEFADRPALAAQLLTDMGGVLARRGRLAEARVAFSDALDLRRAELGPDHPDTLAAQPELGRVLYRMGEGTQSLALLREHLAASERVFGTPSDAVVDALEALGPVESVHGDIETAKRLLERAIAMHTTLHPGPEAGPDAQVKLAWLRHQLAVVWLRAGDYEQARSLQARSLEQFEALLGRLDSRTLEARKNLGFAYRNLKQPERARAIFEQTLADERELYDGAHWQIAFTIGHLANLASDAQDYERAIELWQQAEEETRAAMGEDYHWLLNARIARARSLLLAGRGAEGRAILEEIAALEGREDGMPEKARATLDRYGGE